MVKINLLPDLVIQRRREARIKKLATTALIGWVGLLLLVTGIVFGYSQYQKAVLASTQEAHDALDADVNSSENVVFRKEALAVQASLEALSGLFTSRRSAAEFFETVAAYTPADIRIGELTYGEDNTIIISGIGRSYGAVSTFEAALKASSETAEPEDGASDQVAGYFTDVALLGANITDDNQVGFELRAAYVPPVQTAADNGAIEAIDDAEQEANDE